MGQLYQIYWYPVYAYIRQRGHTHHDAQDLTQGFFERTVEQHTLTGVTREDTKFRSFLLKVLNHFLIDEWRAAKAKKRGSLQVISLEDGAAEARYCKQPIDKVTPEILFDKNWALALLDEVFEELRRENESAGRGDLFEEIKFCITADRTDISYAQLSVRLKISEAALKVKTHRLRQRYRELLRARVADTVSSRQEVESELRYLHEILSR